MFKTAAHRDFHRHAPPEVCITRNFIIIMTLSRRGEDSLHLNIWTPDCSPEHPYPVAFWIHGGGQPVGLALKRSLMESLRTRRDFVTINYRLGILALPHPWLCRKDAMGLANYGIFDQIAALNWVYGIGSFEVIRKI
ncbi:MAG: carboxylesterase family protein [Catenibacillus sp.]